MKEKKLFLVLFLLALSLFILDKKGILAPLTGWLGQIANPIRVKIYSWTKKPEKLFKNLKIGGEVFDEIKKKERELEACQYEFQTLKKENEDLRRLLQAPLPKSWAFLPARVLGKKRYLMIDKGENDEVREGMIAVFENFLVGKVAEANSSSSLVLLPFDSESKISVKTEDGARGLLEGRFGTKVFLTRVLQKENLEVGDLVVTSGEGGYLPDLLIGKIKSKSKESNEPFQEVEVEPGLEYDKLENVFLVKE